MQANVAMGSSAESVPGGVGEKNGAKRGRFPQENSISADIVASQEFIL